jgi:hypothetical protein
MLLRPISLSVPHRKHITSPLRTQQVNGNYRFVFYLKHNVSAAGLSPSSGGTYSRGPYRASRYWTQLSRFHQMTKTESSVRNAVSASELYRPNFRCLSAKLVPTFADRGCRVVSAADPYFCNLGFLDRSRYLFFHVTTQLYPRG